MEEGEIALTVLCDGEGLRSHRLLRSTQRPLASENTLKCLAVRHHPTLTRSREHHHETPASECSLSVVRSCVARASRSGLNAYQVQHLTAARLHCFLHFHAGASTGSTCLRELYAVTKAAVGIRDFIYQIELPLRAIPPYGQVAQEHEDSGSNLAGVLNYFQHERST